MEKEKCIKYLILAEIEKKGFLIKFIDNYEEAEKFASITFDLSDEFQFSEMSKVEMKLTFFASYQVNGSEVHIGWCKKGITNGAYSVSVIEIDMNNFNLNQFILERINHSTVFSYEIYNCELDRILDLFPRPDFMAN